MLVVSTDCGVVVAVLLLLLLLLLGLVLRRAVVSGVFARTCSLASCPSSLEDGSSSNDDDNHAGGCKLVTRWSSVSGSKGASGPERMRSISAWALARRMRFLFVRAVVVVVDVGVVADSLVLL